MGDGDDDVILDSMPNRVSACLQGWSVQTLTKLGLEMTKHFNLLPLVHILVMMTSMSIYRRTRKTSHYIQLPQLKGCAN